MLVETPYIDSSFTAKASAKKAVHDRLSQVWDEIQVEGRKPEYRGKSHFANLTLSMFLPDVKAPHAHFPVLKGHAAEIKWLIPMLRTIWRRHHDNSNEDDRCLFRCLVHLSKIHECVDHTPADGESPYYLPESVHNDLQEACDKFLM